MEFLILGPLEVRAGGRPLALSGPKQRALLAILLIHANEVVSTDRLIDQLWADDPPETGRAALQMRVSALRKTLQEVGQRQSPSDRLVTRPPGYLLRVDTNELDSYRFERLLAEGRRAMRAGRAEAAAHALREGLSLWRGDPIADFAYSPFAQLEIARLAELRTAAFEERIEADLELGRHADVIGGLEAHVAAHPLRERPRGQLMLALYRAGRQAEALAVFHATRRVLVEDLGLEPGAPLQLLERQILLQDSALDAGIGAMPAPAEEVDRPMPERRKTVTVAMTEFLEPAGRPEIDPEPLRQIGERCVTVAATVYEQHGGVVEPSFGPNLVAVFGNPVLHEDDALRALRAASSLDGALAALSDELERDYGVRISVRTGVATGEVITGVPALGRPPIVGEPMTLAGQLLQRASPGQILLAETTRRMVESVVRVVPIELRDSAPSWRLVEIGATVPLRPIAPDATFVGRRNELAQLWAAYDRARRDRTLHLCLVIGSAGIGKSRLVQEFVSDIADSATVVFGRCLAYGEGITFWPLREIVRELAPGGEIASLLRDDADAAMVAERVAGAVGLAETVASVEETFWAVRRLFQAVARERPLAVIVEDIHWAEPTLLNMLEYLAARMREAPMLLVCLARPELLAARPGFGASSVNATSILLEPLAEDESQALMDDRLGAIHLDSATRARINWTAEGNPLFLEQMVAMVAQQGVPSGELPVPPTIQALIAARLDRLDPGEREVLECAAVIGKEFSPAAVAGLLPEEAQASTERHLDALVGKDLIRTVPAGRASEEFFRFRHVLIQQSAYRSIPKRLRAETHHAFADWLESKRGSPLAEVEEPVGYHLEQAFRYRSEIAPISDAERGLASRAAERLASAGLRAFKAGDMPASGNLLGRAAALMPPDDAVRLSLLSDLGFALFEVGELERSSVVLAEVIARGIAISDRRAVARATVQRAHVEMYRHPEEVDQARLLREAASAMTVLRVLHDDAGLARAFLLISEVEWTLGSGARATRAAEQAAHFSRRAQSRREEAWSHGDYGYYAVFGPTTVADGTRRMERWLAEAGGDAVVEANLVGFLAPLAAMEGRITEARERLAESRVATETLGLRWQTGTHDLLGCVIEMLADDPVAAGVHLQRSIEMFTEMGDMWFLSILSIEQARALHQQGRDREALALIGRLDALPTDPSFSYRIRRAEILGRLLARGGDQDDAMALARQAVELAERTDFLGFHADALCGLAEVHLLGGRLEGATEALGSAIRLYERKGNVVAARRARAQQLKLST
jgi:DNA-binding SARP family transcriptional activator/tetratricopeptide (TPR) repeat protein